MQSHDPVRKPRVTASRHALSRPTRGPWQGQLAPSWPHARPAVPSRRERTAHATDYTHLSAEERRVGKNYVRTCRTRWSPDHPKPTQKQTTPNHYSTAPSQTTNQNTAPTQDATHT